MAPEALEAADLIAYLHRSRDELDRMQQQMAAERQALEEERKKLRGEWVERQQKRIQRAGRKIRGDAKALRRKRGARSGGGEGKELRGSLEKSARRKTLEVRGRSAGRIERRGGADDFGIAAGPRDASRLRMTLWPRRSCSQVRACVFGDSASRWSCGGWTDHRRRLRPVRCG